MVEVNGWELAHSYPTFEIKFEPRDLWVGVYWRSERKLTPFLHVWIYICIVPMLPIVIKFLFTRFKLRKDK